MSVIIGSANPTTSKWRIDANDGKVNLDDIPAIKPLVDRFVDDIIVTTPYKQQERLFQLNHIKKSNYYNTRLRIGTIDEFQGQESEVTIVSMVRSNNNTDYQKAVGFVNIPRSCVAFSRSKRKTIIVGDQKTLTKSKFLSRSIDTVVRKDGFFM
jgi:superfamily I DNA and/or RNA helicase